MKSKIPCEPGPAPLMKLAQATGLCGGMLVPRSLTRRGRGASPRLGSRPAAIIRFDRRGSIPSTPMTMTFFPMARDALRRPPTQ